MKFIFIKVDSNKILTLAIALSIYCTDAMIFQVLAKQQKQNVHSGFYKYAFNIEQLQL
jgi:hypothetical protein